MTAAELTSVELTKAYLARIAALNNRGPGLNAVRLVNPDALTDAALLDLERKKTGARGPLHGIPVLVKDNLDVAGLPTTAGAVALEHSIATVGLDRRRPAAVGRRRDPRQDQPQRVRELHHQQQPERLLRPRRPGSERARRRPEPERLVVRLGHRGGRRPGGGHDRHRDLRLDRQPVGGAGDRRPAPDRRPRQPLRHRADRRLAGHRGADDAHGRRRRRRAGGDRGRRPARPAERAAARRDPATAAGAARLPRRARPERAGRQADRDRGQQRSELPGRGGRDRGSRRGHADDPGAERQRGPADPQLRVQARPQRLPRAPRARRADEVAGRRDRLQRGEPAGGDQVRADDPDRQPGARHQPGLGRHGGLPDRPGRTARP